MKIYFENAFFQGDILSFNPELCYNGYPRYKSNIGLFFSFILYIAIFCIFIYFFINFVDGDKLNVIESEEYDFDSRIKLNSKFILFKLADSNYNPIPEGIFNIFVFFTIEAKGQLFDLKPITIKDCNINDFTDQEIKQINANISSFKCISPSPEYSEIKYQKEPYDINYLRIGIGKCSISSYTGINYCLSEEEMDNYIKNNVILFEFLLPADYADHKSSKNPIIRSYKKYFKYIPKGLSSSTVKLKKIFYNSDDGLIFTRIKVYEGVNIYEIEDTNQEHSLPYENIGEIHYILELISSDMYSVKLNRTYAKFQDFLATMGGIFSLIYNFFRILTFLITRGLFFRDLLLLPTNENYLKLRKNKSKEISEFNLYLENNANKNLISVMSNDSHIQINKPININQNIPDLGLNERKSNLNLFQIYNSNVGIITKNKTVNATIDRENLYSPFSINYSTVHIKKKIALLSQINCCNSFLFSIFPCSIKKQKINLLNNLGKIVSYYLSSDELVFNNIKLEMLMDTTKKDKEKKNSVIEQSII